MAAVSVLGFATLEPLLARQAAIVLQGEFDLGPYARVDSAGIAFLLELQRRAIHRGQALRLTGASEQCRRLAAFLGVDTLLGLSTETPP
jgi:ABC-type transporter Mla MlaB component